MSSDETEKKITVKDAQRQVTEAEKVAGIARKELKAAKQDQVRENLAESKKISKKELAKGKTKLPGYFDPRNKYNSQAEQREAITEAMNFLLGIRYETDGKTGIKKKFHVGSYSAKITYTGGRRVISERIKLARENPNPNTNNWRLFINAARFFASEEHRGFIKDPEFIRNCLTGSNFIVRFVKDKRTKIKDLKKQTLERDEKRALGMPLRVREDKLRMGVQFPVRPAEARELLEKEEDYNKRMGEKAKEEGKDEKDIEPYFPEKSKKYLLKQSKKKEEKE